MGAQSGIKNGSVDGSTTGIAHSLSPALPTMPSWVWFHTTTTVRRTGAGGFVAAISRMWASVRVDGRAGRLVGTPSGTSTVDVAHLSAFPRTMTTVRRTGAGESDAELSTKKSACKVTTLAVKPLGWRSLNL